MNQIQVNSFEESLQRFGVLIYGNRGDSMCPLIREGRDKVVISPKPQGRLSKYDVPLYRRDDGKYVLHRIMKVRKNDYLICGDNRYYLEEGIDDHHIIGVMTGIIRNGETLRVSDSRYRLYVVVWCWRIPFLIRRIALKARSFLRKCFVH